MFVGVDHGTRAIRFATSEGCCYVLPRKKASNLSTTEIVNRITDALGLEDVKLLALTYSMGDGLTKIVKIEDATNHGVTRQDGAGILVGGGTKVFDAMMRSGWPVILLPGIHQASEIDPRLKVFSHGASPEKVGLAYKVHKDGVSDFIVSDASSNVVTLGVVDGKIMGAIDAPIFAPGLLHGPLDVEAIRNVDSGKITANQAFTNGGILRKLGVGSLDECSPNLKKQALETLALFSSMELSAMQVLLKDLGAPEPKLYLAGDPAFQIAGQVSVLMSREVRPLDNCDAALGCALIAEDVYRGKKNILGLEVDEKVQR
ncbi:MAG: methanogenesis marker 12 protein [Methanotrichaceae archaeon]